MRSKRMLTLLLVICLVLSCVAPAAAIQPGEGTAAVNVSDSTQNSLSTQRADSKQTVSAQENGMIVSGEGAAANTLRGQTPAKENAGSVVAGEDQAQNGAAEGRWEITEGWFDGNLFNAELPASVLELREAADSYAADEQVSAFVVLEGAPVAANSLKSEDNLSFNSAKLEQEQTAVINAIEKQVLGGADLQVEHQFTYLANAISVTTAFGNLEKIALLDGVKSVFLMPQYQLTAADALVELPAQPATASSGEMVGAPTVWEELGFTGEGMTIAIIDTGLDLDHPSFAAAPAGAVLSAKEIQWALKNLNAAKYLDGVTADELYRSEKVPFAFNYVDASLTADHSADPMGDHGTHVAGIAAANKVEGVDAVGMAPDAQLVVMKVFGANGGAYMDDIVAGLEDAMMLGVDVVNMSLGTTSGFSKSAYDFIDGIYAIIDEHGTIVNASAGNDGTSSYMNMWGTDLNTTSNPDNAAVGSPSTYANVNSIASVDNAMVASNAICVNGEDFMYNDAIGLYVTFDSLAGQDLEYVMVPGLGNIEDFDGLDVEGKVAVIARGTINFALKLANAEANGAIGVIITNNEPGSIANFGMSMTDEYDQLLDGVSGYVPCVLVSMAAGEALAANEGGTFTVYGEQQMIPDEAGGQMSSFSSWGPSNDLRLLPDMAGVGGNILSTTDDGTYSVMSGTSMSAPQVAGVSALVAEYLQSLGYNHQIVPRMTTALLMSTAVPVVSQTSGVEASPRQQGAGLVNAANALTAEAYLTVDASENRKPKGEIGDSAEGTYSFTFTVHNFGEEEKTYALNASVLTESVIDYGVEVFMAGYDAALEGDVTFSTGDSVTVAAGESVDVTVTIALTENDKAVLDYYYPAGGYVEGYVYLDAENGVDLSLPYMGFYGDWTEPSAFDTAYWYDNSFWGVSPENGLPEGNEYYHVFWTNLQGTDWVLGMNPYTGATVDENGNIEYDPANNVISNNGDGLVDNLSEIYLSMMRNATNLHFVYTDENGNVVYEEESLNVNKTMYLSNYGRVVPYLHSWWYPTPWDFTDETGAPVAHGTKLTLTITAVLDYEGEFTEQSISLPITIDTEAPVPAAVQTQLGEDGSVVMNITFTDDTNPAYAVLMNPSGSQTYAEAVPGDFVRNEDGSWSVALDVTDCGGKFLLVLADYGANEGYYNLQLTGDQLPEDGNLPEVDKDALYAYRVYDAGIYDDSLYGWITIDKETAETQRVTNDMYEFYALTAAEYVDGYVFAVDAGYNFLVIEPGTWNRTVIRNLGVSVLDMTFNKADNTMYVSTKAADPSGYGNIFTLSTLDLLTGEMTVLTEDTSAYSLPYAMAATDDGVIYAIKYYNSYLYTVNTETWELEYVLDATGNNLQLTRANGNVATPYYSQSMTYSSADECIYWAFFTYTSDAELFTINVSDEIVSYTATEFPVDAECVGVLTMDEDPDYTLPEAEALSELLLTAESMILLEGDSAQLGVYLLPWNYTPASELVWSSDDETVATVENGVVTAVSEGNAVITVSCEGVEASCIVNVVHAAGTIYAYDYYNGTGDYEDWIAIDLSDMSYTSLFPSPVDFTAADYNGHDGYVYGYNLNGQFFRMDPATGEAVALGSPVSSVPTDMAYDYSTGLMYAVTVDQNAYTSTLWNVNMNTGALVEVATTYNLFMTLACDTEGGLYAISSEGVLYYLFVYEADMGGGWMPLSEEGTTTMMIEPMYIMEGLGMLNYAQSMCFDHNNRVLIWASPENGNVYWIDIFAYEPFILPLGDPTGTGVLEFMGMYSIPDEIPELAYTPVESVTAEDMLLMVGASKFASVAVNPLNATNQDIVLTSEDESVVTTDGGMVTAVAEGTAVVNGTLTDGDATHEFSFKVTVKRSAGYINGYVAADLYSGGGQAWAVFSDQDPSNDIDYPAATDYMIYAEEYLDGKLYAYGYDPYDWEANFQFMVIDAATYEIESMTDMGDGFPFVYDMSYDYTTGTMYAVAGYNDSSSDLYMVNMQTGELVLCMEVEPFIMSLAVAADGTVYGASASTEEYDPFTWSSVWANSMLYTFDVVNGTYEAAFDTGVRCNKLASMAFDFDTGNLYWTAMFQASYWDPAESGLYMIDVNEQASYNLGPVGPAGSQMTGLYIIADEYPETPDELYNITLTDAAVELNVGDSYELSVFVQPMGFPADLAWTSSDETVATVENGVITAVAPGIADITVTSGDKSSVCRVIVFGANDYFVTWNNTDAGFTKLNRMNTEIAVNLTEGETEANVRSMTMVDGKIYGYDVENKFFVIESLKTFERTYIGEADLSIPEDSDSEDFFYEVRDLVWDGERLLALTCTSVSVTEEWYGSVNTSTYELVDGCEVYEVDLTTGSLSYVNGFWTAYGDSISNVYGMTVDADGVYYIYSSYDDYFSTVDLETGVITQLTTLQNQAIYGDSDGNPMAMEYDPMSGKIFLLFTQNGSYYRMVSYNPADSKLTVEGYVGEVVYDEDTWSYDADTFAGLFLMSEAEAESTKFSVVGSSMTLSNSLAMNFYLNSSDITGEGWYAELVTENETVKVALEDCAVNGIYTVVTYNGIAAKQMTDTITLTVYNAEGNAVSRVYTDSVRAYAMRMFGKGMDTMLVDMLNYGAEAQLYFGYKTEDLANSKLTDEQKAMATESVELSDNSAADEAFIGSSLNLESNIELNLFFQVSIGADLTAVVTYVNHNGKEVTVEQAASVENRLCKVAVDTLAVADARQIVSCQLIDEDGNVVATAADSVESYCARMSELALCEPLMKFADSAYNFFH